MFALVVSKVEITSASAVFNKTLFFVCVVECSIVVSVCIIELVDISDTNAGVVADNT